MARVLSAPTLIGASPAAERAELEPEGFSEIKVLVIRRLEDAIVVRWEAPDWLPFIPGSSYLVPPHSRSCGVAELVSKLAKPMTEEEIVSFTIIRGWSSVYFMKGKGRKLDPFWL